LGNTSNTEEWVTVRFNEKENCVLFKPETILFGSKVEWSGVLVDGTQIYIEYDASSDSKDFFLGNGGIQLNNLFVIKDARELWDKLFDEHGGEEAPKELVEEITKAYVTTGDNYAILGSNTGIGSNALSSCNTGSNNIIIGCTTGSQVMSTQSPNGSCSIKSDGTVEMIDTNGFVTVLDVKKIVQMEKDIVILQKRLAKLEISKPLDK